MAKYGIGAEVLIKAIVEEVIETKEGIKYFVKFDGSFTGATVREKEIVEDGE